MGVLAEPTGHPDRLDAGDDNRPVTAVEILARRDATGDAAESNRAPCAALIWANRPEAFCWAVSGGGGEAQRQPSPPPPAFQVRSSGNQPKPVPLGKTTA